jgi:hypothetical protein
MPADSGRDAARWDDLSDCPSCGEPLAAGSVVCVKCGLDLRTGRYLQTTVVPKQDDAADADEISDDASEEFDAAEYDDRDEDAAEIIKSLYCPRCSGTRQEGNFLCDDCTQKVSARKQFLRRSAGTMPVPRLCPYCSETLLPKESVCGECYELSDRSGIVSAVFPQCTSCGKVLGRGVVVCPVCGHDHAF